jgi:hypothetical protein
MTLRFLTQPAAARQSSRAAGSTPPTYIHDLITNVAITPQIDAPTALSAFKCLIYFTLRFDASTQRFVIYAMYIERVHVCMTTIK